MLSRPQGMSITFVVSAIGRSMQAKYVSCVIIQDLVGLHWAKFQEYCERKN